MTNTCRSEANQLKLFVFLTIASIIASRSNTLGLEASFFYFVYYSRGLKSERVPISDGGACSVYGPIHSKSEWENRDKPRSFCT